MKQYGISSWIAADLPCDLSIEKLASAGFKETELSAERSELVKAFEADPEKVRRQLEAAGLGVRAVHDPDRARKLDHPDEAIRRKATETIGHYFSLAKAVGAELLVVHSSDLKWVVPEEGVEARRGRSMDSLNILAEHADKVGMKMAVENLPGGGYSPPVLTHDLLQIIEGLGDHVGICLDVGHSYLSLFNPLEELRDVSSRLLSLHIHDVKNGKDHLIPGEGEMDLEAFVQELDRMEFGGVRTLEISPKGERLDEALELLAAVRERWRC